ncbi:ATP-dependent DNA ligase [Novosphingobium chloroacetimidivorans]|uniref:ATP-dependent DNA ligase n=1 Tax=Novosphingobium chloroacetimidivorans TaxID=1428314 RepID=A0A7W7KB69_9SPHN|nr:hypothetical protein [Novosphingobium chloroacetimidivorans]MBB4859607.1 ATP-dependent DNA ligase [Novosphingobium chloroacetimidivorans]
MPEGGVLAERKWDGWRCLYFRGLDGKPRLWSRNGMPLEGADHILHRLMLIEEQAGENLFIDGEVVVDGTLAATKQWFERGYRKGGVDGTLHLFDVMAEAQWRAGGAETPLIERKALLAGLVEQMPADTWEWREGSHGADEAGCVQLVADTWLFDDAQVLTEAQRVWAQDGEGLMLKDAAAPYICSRTSSWLKVKQANAGKWKAAA